MESGWKALILYNVKNMESMDKKKQVIELIKEDSWHSIPVENIVNKIFSILGVSESDGICICETECIGCYHKGVICKKLKGHSR